MCRHDSHMLTPDGGFVCFDCGQEQAPEVPDSRPFEVAPVGVTFAEFLAAARH